MRPSPNPHLIRLTPQMAPKHWRSRQAERLFRAALEGDADRHAAQGTILVSMPPSEPAMSPHGTDPEAAAHGARIEIDRLRRHADHLEGLLNVYGGGAFVAQLHPVLAPRGHIKDVESFLLTVTDRATHVRINGKMFERDASGALVEATARRSP